jgi:hypothetical protein
MLSRCYVECLYIGHRGGAEALPGKLGPRTTAWKPKDIAALVKNLGGQESKEYGSKSGGEQTP